MWAEVEHSGHSGIAEDFQSDGVAIETSAVSTLFLGLVVWSDGFSRFAHQRAYRRSNGLKAALPTPKNKLENALVVDQSHNVEWENGDRQ